MNSYPYRCIMMKERGAKRIGIVKTLLENPNGTLSIYKLAKQANCDWSWANDVIKELEKENIVERTKVKDRKRLGRLLQDWRIEPNVKLELPRGMKDFESDELSKINIIRKKFQEKAESFGFKQMDPSPIELLSTLEAKGGPAIRDEVYNFKDKKKRKIALRFDFTVGLTRYVVSQKDLKLPAKFSAFGGVWRYDEPQKGRYRFFNQWNVEIYGKSSVETDAEIIEFTSSLFDSFDLQNITIDINERNLVQSYIIKIFGQSADENLIGDILRAIDKTQKKKETEILEEYKEKGYDQNKLTKILEFAKIKGTPGEIESKFDVSDLESWDKLKELWDSLKNRDVQNIRINFGIVRGLDYYSGMVFEVFDTTSDLGALAGGGRYDSLTKAFGREDIGATGVAGGVERILLTMEKQGVIKNSAFELISVLYVNQDVQKQAMNIASKLRRKEISVLVDLSGKNLRKQMVVASNSKFVIIVGPKELESNSVVLRDMKSGKEKNVKIDELVSNPNSFLK
jgi:histidyl-tRNA synthetase